MRLSFQYLKSPLFIYTVKCLIGLSIGYWLYVTFPNHQFFWCMITVLLVLSPDPQDSSRLAFDRMKANTIGCLIGLVLFLVHGSGLLSLCIAAVVTIIVCSLLNLMTVGRTALAAMMIVMVHEKTGATWQVALERLGCVITGCLIALGLTIVFSFITKKWLAS